MADVQSDQAREQMNTVEAALFVSGKALSAQELSQAIGIASIGHVKRLADQLMEEYSRRGGSLCVLKIGDKYIMSIKDSYAGRVSSVAGKPELTKGSLRVLAYISKNEPLMQSSLVRTFGSSVYDHVKELVGGDFVRATKEGRSKRLETTQKFREYFNLSG